MARFDFVLTGVVNDADDEADARARLASRLSGGARSFDPSGVYVDEASARLSDVDGDDQEERLDAMIDASQKWEEARSAMAEFDHDGWYMNGAHFTCTESDAICAMLEALDLPTQAGSLRTGHAEGDEEGDAHYVAPETGA